MQKGISFIKKTVSLNGKGFIKFNLEDDDLNSLVGKLNPEIIIDCAAYSNIKFCEENKEEAYNLNVGLPKKVIEICKRSKVKLVYFSSGEIFKGKDGLIKEEDDPNPINYYGKTKLESENLIRNNLKDYIIIRTSVVFGWNKPFQHLTFLSLIYNKLKNKEKIEMFTDKTRTPAYINDLTKAVLKLIEKGILHS